MARNEIQTYTEEDLAGLSESERAALLDEDDEDDEQREKDEAARERAALEAVAADEASEARRITEEVLGDDPNKAAAEAAAAVTTPPAGRESARDEADRLEAEIVSVKTANVDEAKARITELQGQRNELAEKLQNGDVDFAEYQKQMDGINDEIADRKADIRTAEIEAQRVTASQEQLWKRQCDAFFEEHADTYPRDSLRWKALNAAVIEIANVPENGSLSGRKILAMAHERMVKEGLVVQKGTTPTTPPKKPAKAQEEFPTLAGKPAAEHSETGNDKFAYLDNLPQHELENELGKLSERDRQAYLTQA